MPISSEAPPGGAIEDMPEPFASAVRPASRAWAIASLTASWLAGFTSAGVSTSNWKDIVPTRPSSDSGSSARAFASASAFGVPSLTAWSTIVFSWSGAAVAGLASGASAGTCGPSVRSATRASTAFEYVGSARVCPSGAATTTVTVAWSKASWDSGKSSAWRSAAFSDGMPGMENASVIGLDIVAATAPTASMATSQPARKKGHRR